MNYKLTKKQAKEMLENRLLHFFGVSKAKVSEGKNPYRIMFYNVENYFDTKDDPEKNDNDFLPESKKHWTYNKMEEKRNSIAKVITAVGEGMPVAIVGMCEVENDYVLTSLVRYSPLKNYGYNVIDMGKDVPCEDIVDRAIAEDAVIIGLFFTSKF